MSELDTRLGDALADTLNTLSPGMGASAKSLRFEEMLARLHNLLSDGPDVSRLTSSVPEMLAGIYNAGVGGSSATARNTSVPALLAGIANAYSDDPDVTRQTTSLARLWDLALTNPRTGGGGGAGAFAVDAVSLDGSTYAERADIIGPASITGYLSSEWFLLPSYPTGNNNEPGIWGCKPLSDGQFGSYIYEDGPVVYLEGNFADDVFADANGFVWKDPPPPSLLTWHNRITAFDFRSGTLKADALLDGVRIEMETGGAGPASATFNGETFQVGRFDIGFGGPYNWIGGLGPLWWDANFELDGNGHIPDATLAKLRDPLTGKPPDMGANGELVTGTPPIVFMKLAVGAPAVSAFDNLGTGGAFTVTGTPTVHPSSPTD